MKYFLFAFTLLASSSAFAQAPPQISTTTQNVASQWALYSGQQENVTRAIKALIDENAALAGENAKLKADLATKAKPEETK